MSLKIFKIHSTKDLIFLNSELKNFSNSTDFYSIINGSLKFPVEFIKEAYDRSAKFSSTRFRERSSYFLCLLSGKTNLDNAIKEVGFCHNDRNGIFLTDSEDILHQLSEYVDQIIPYVTDVSDSKKFYGEMTMVELELIRSDRT